MVTTTAYVYNIENRLTTTTKTTGGIAVVTEFYYDQNGNTTRQRIGANTIDFSYDNRNQMILAHDLNGLSTGTTYSASNVYNPEGLRIMEDLTQNGVTETTNYLYEYSHVVLETDDVGNETGYNVYATIR